MILVISKIQAILTQSVGERTLGKRGKQRVARRKEGNGVKGKETDVTKERKENENKKADGNVRNIRIFSQYRGQVTKF